MIPTDPLHRAMLDDGLLASPLNHGVGGETSREILARQAAEKDKPSVTMLMDDPMASDHLHLTPDGYDAVAQHLLPSLDGVESTWRDIESAPKDGTEILVWDTEHTIARWIDGEWMPCLPDQQPTHWMPLPQPPEETK